MEPCATMARPRVGYVLKKFPRLSETFILSELLGVEAAGYDVRIFGHRPADDEPRHKDLAALRASVEVLAEDRKSVASVLDGAGTARAEIESLMQRLPEKQARGMVAQGAVLAQAVRTRGLTHLHAHFMTVAARLVHVAHLLTGVPYTVTAHAKDIWRKDIDREFFARVAERAHALVTVSDDNARFLREDLLRGRKVRIERIYNGLPDSIGVLSLTREPDLIVAVGRLVEKKGFADLLRALALLRDAQVPCRCALIGDGEERPRLEALAAELQLGEQVQILGLMPREDVLSLMARARVLALPCIRAADGNQDALPTVVLEALALGTPVVATPVGGIPEIVHHAVHGLIVPEGECEALARGLRTLLEDHTLWAQCSSAGPTQIEAHFRQRNTLPQLCALFEGHTA
jgi:glycosyltransferase involved in cell wall biosynthesis